jgi:hypothetical protein
MDKWRREMHPFVIVSTSRTRADDSIKSNVNRVYRAAWVAELVRLMWPARVRTLVRPVVSMETVIHTCLRTILYTIPRSIH